MAEIKKDQIFEAIELIAKQNLLTKEEATTVIEEAIKKAFYSKFDPDANLELIMNEDENEFKLINHSKLVVADEEFLEEHSPLEIALSDAIKLNPEAQEGEEISAEVDFSLYSRQVALQIKQMLTQSVREKKKEAIYAQHKSLIGEMIDVTVSIVNENFVIFTLDNGTTAFMPSNLRNNNITLKVGQRTQVYVEDVLQESKDSQIVVSNGSKDVIKRVLEAHVPEIADGTVEIVEISRMAGERSKVAVRTTNENVDPVGAIIGAQGTRISSIVEKLEGEKLDIILWSHDVNTFVANALSPARIASVIDKLDRNGEVTPGHKIAIAPDKQQTLAIGKKGSNVRLAVELTKIRIDVISHSEAVEKGINVELNVGLTAKELEDLDAGLKVKRQPTNRRVVEQAPRFDETSFENDMESFASSIEEEQNQVEEKDKFDIDDSLFTEEQLKQMQSEFEFDDEISEMGDSNGDDEYYNYGDEE